MKAKELLRCLVKSGVLAGQITTKEYLKSFKLVEGHLLSNKEYFYTFTEVVYCEPSAIVETPCCEMAYLYQI